jgi:hypothetical protein
MRVRHFSVVLALLCTSCASNVGQRDATGNPKLERIMPEEIASIEATRPAHMSADDLVLLSREGVAADQIIDRYRQSGARLRLNEGQITDLRRRGVDERVIQHIIEAERSAQKTDAITAQADREAQDRIRREQQARFYYYDPWGPYPYYWGPRVYPYLGYGWHRWGSGWHGGFGIGF